MRCTTAVADVCGPVAELVGSEASDGTGWDVWEQVDPSGIRCCTEC